MSEGEEKRPVGRPHIPINPARLEEIVMIGATCLECASEFNCSEDTIVNFVKDNYGMNFSEFRDFHFAKTQIRLKRAQLQIALGGKFKKMIKTRKRTKNPDGSVTIEEVPTVYEYEAPPNVRMLEFLGRALLKQSDESAAVPEHLKNLSTEAPKVEIIVNSKEPVPDKIVESWVDQEAIVADLVEDP